MGPLVNVLLLPALGALASYGVFLLIDPAILYNTAAGKRRACRRWALLSFPVYVALGAAVTLLFAARR